MWVNASALAPRVDTNLTGVLPHLSAGRLYFPGCLVLVYTCLAKHTQHKIHGLQPKVMDHSMQNTHTHTNQDSLKNVLGRLNKNKNEPQKSLSNIHLGLQTPNLDPSSSSDFLDVPLPSPALSPPEHEENWTKNMSRPRLNILLPGPGGMGRSLFNIYAPPREHHLLYSKWGSPSPQGRLPRCCSPGAPQGLPGGSVRASY